MKKLKTTEFATRAIHVGGEPDPTTGAVMPPIYQTSTYAQTSPGKHQGYEYTRSHNPTRSRLEECLASLEQAKFALTTASGMAAINLILQSLPADSLIFCGDDVYGGTFRILHTLFNQFHRIKMVDTTDLKTLKQQLDAEKPALLWIESPTNPLLKITDIKKASTMAHQHDCLVVVDNTFMTPRFQNPLVLGADIVVHSLTKYINGHSDVIGGALMLNHKKLYQQLWTLQNTTGPSQSPFESWLVLRGIKTLGLRMERHQENALKLAKWLEQHPQVERVVYPGLKSHPQHTLAKKQQSGFSGMITFFLKGGLKESKRFLKKLKIFTLAESLGGVESLVDHPAIMTHASIPKKEREQLGVTNNLIRLSVGVEDIKDLLQDLATALPD